MIDVYLDAFDHPYLLLLLPICGVLLGLSAIAEMSGWQTGAAFLALYAMAALIICLIGFFALYALKFSTGTLRWWRFRRLDSE